MTDYGLRRLINKQLARNLKKGRLGGREQVEEEGQSKEGECATTQQGTLQGPEDEVDRARTRRLKNMCRSKWRASCVTTQRDSSKVTQVQKEDSRKIDYEVKAGGGLDPREQDRARPVDRSNRTVKNFCTNCMTG